MNEDEKPIIMEQHGNNFIVRCVVCERQFLLSQHIDKRGRNCPGCGETRAYVGSDKKTVLMHRIKKNEPA